MVHLKSKQEYIKYGFISNICNSPRSINRKFSVSDGNQINGPDEKFWKLSVTMTGNNQRKKKKKVNQSSGIRARGPDLRPVDRDKTACRSLQEAAALL